MNDIDIKLVGCTAVNWELLTAALSNLKGVHVLDKVDGKFKDHKINEMSRLIYALSLFSGSQTVEKINQDGLKHISFSFMIHVPAILRWDFFFKGSEGILFTQKESKYKDMLVILCSGSMKAWKDFIITFCARDVSQISRQFANQLMLTFESIGLNFVLGEYRKVSLNDKTFSLELICD